MRARKLVGAHREHEHERPRGRSRHEQRDEVEGRAVGPLDILDDEYQRPLGDQPADDAKQQLQDPRRVRVARRLRRTPVRQLGDQATNLAAGRTQQRIELLGWELDGQRPQHVDERGERDPAAVELDAAAHQGPRTCATAPGDQLADQPRLADTGLPADDQRDRRPVQRPLERLVRSRQFRLASNQDRTNNAASHCARFYGSLGARSRQEKGPARSERAGPAKHGQKA